MKKILLLLLIGLASLARAYNTEDHVFEPPQRYSELGNETSATYALSTALTATTSTEIDLSSYAGFYLSTTGTSTLVEVDFAGNTYQPTIANAPWNLTQTFNGPVSQFVKKAGRWARIRNSRLNAPATTMTAWYFRATTPSNPVISGSLTSAGNVSLNAGTSVIGNLGTAGNVSLNAGTSSIGSVQIGGGTSSTVTDSNSNTAPVFAMPQENLTVFSNYSVLSSTVTVVNITTTVGTICPLGTSVWIGSPSANLLFTYGNLSFTPSVSQMAAGWGDQLAANALPLALPWPIRDGGKIYLCGNAGSATVSLKMGCFLAK